APELHHVSVRAVADAVHEDYLVLRAVERTHARIALVPDADVEDIFVNLTRGRRHVIEVAPVHADEVNCACSRDGLSCAECLGEEGTGWRFDPLTRRQRALSGA